MQYITKIFPQELIVLSSAKLHIYEVKHTVYENKLLNNKGSTNDIPLVTEAETYFVFCLR